MKRTVRLIKYDPAVEEPRFITLVESAEVDEPEGLNDGGNEFYYRLAAVCRQHGETMKSYSYHSPLRKKGEAPGLDRINLRGRRGVAPVLRPKVDYDVVVW